MAEPAGLRVLAMVVLAEVGEAEQLDKGVDFLLEREERTRRMAEVEQAPPFMGLLAPGVMVRVRFHLLLCSI